ncbi:uncharacterized protein G2W53_013911 [Senna tora]|uniref:Uncharacterized protein n=1 Tax=Senna tora TaxID=362788 RepID=A0A834TZJ5_9FABA|nr:uncharacterized protein G2W53_013911 [Senna tora]
MQYSHCLTHASYHHELRLLLLDQVFVVFDRVEECCVLTLDLGHKYAF